MPAYRQLPSGLWQATIRTPNGRRTRTDSLKGVVRTWAVEEEARIRRGEWADPQDGKMTLQEWWVKWSTARDVELATARREESHWRVHVEPRWGGVQLGKITAWDVEAWSTQMSRKGVGATTRGHVIRLLRMLMSEAARHRLVVADPTSGVKVPSPPKHVDRILTRPEWDRLDDASAQDALIRCLAFAGLRWGEAAGLHSHRVDLGRRQIEVVETIRRDRSVKPQPKSRAGRRVVPLTDMLADTLRPLLSGRRLLFPAADGHPLDYSNWRRDVWLPTVKAAALDDPQPTPHDLRHSYGSWLAEMNVPIPDIAELMGHGTLRSTERYMHSGDARMDRARLALTGAAQIAAR